MTYARVKVSLQGEGNAQKRGTTKERPTWVHRYRSVDVGLGGGRSIGTKGKRFSLQVASNFEVCWEDSKTAKERKKRVEVAYMGTF